MQEVRVLHENGALYALLSDSLCVFMNESEPGATAKATAKATTKATTKATASLLRRVCSVVAIGVLLRDYDFQRFPPDSDEDASDWLLQHRGTCAQTIGDLLSAALLDGPSDPSNALAEAFRCQLLRSVLRAYSRAIDLLPDAIVALFRSVGSQRERDR